MKKKDQKQGNSSKKGFKPKFILNEGFLVEIDENNPLIEWDPNIPNK